MKPSAAAARAAASISARVALRRPKPMFSATVAESSTDSWLDHGDLVAERGQRQRADVVAVDQDAPRRRVVEPRQEVEDRGLARARAADEGDAHPRLDHQVHPRRAPRGRRDRRNARPRSGSCPSAPLQGLRPVEDGVLGVEQHEDAVERRRPLLHRGEVAAEPPRRPGDHAETGQQAGEVGDGDGARPGCAGRRRRAGSPPRCRPAPPSAAPPAPASGTAGPEPEEPLEERCRRWRRAAPPGGRCAPCGCPRAPR